LNYDGMIIDVTDPDNAWRKQILKVRSKWCMDWVYQKMKKLRANIDVLDASY
jgi:hypothetical protein